MQMFDEISEDSRLRRRYVCMHALFVFGEDIFNV